MTVSSYPATTASPNPFAYPGDDTAAQTVPQFVQRNARRWSNQTAFRAKSGDDWSSLNWTEVDTAMTEIAAGLVDLGFGQLRCGYVLGSNEPEFFIAEYALQALHAIAFPMFEQMTAAEMRTTLPEYGGQVAFAGSTDIAGRLLEVAGEVGLSTIVQWGGDRVRDERVLSLAEVRERGRAHGPTEVTERIARGSLDDIACVILTSGTTGKSKGVLGSYRYMLDTAFRYKSVYDAEPFDSYLSYLPAAFSVEQYCGMTLAAALPLDVACAESPATAERDFVSTGARFRFLGPRQWEEIRSHVPVDLLDDATRLREQANQVRENLGLTQVKAGISAGGSLSTEVFEFFRDIGLNIRSVYGFAEVGIVTGTRDGDGFDNVGHPLPSPYGEHPIALRISENDEVEIGGGVTCSGYWGDRHTLPRTSDGWIRSGDAGTWDGQVLRIVDRVDNIQRLPDGNRFTPQPIETNVLRSSFISHIVLIGGRGDDSRIGALVQLNAEAVAAHLGDSVHLDHAVLASNPHAGALIVDELRRLADDAEQSQRVAVIGIIPKEMSPEGGELTRSMKLRRTEVMRRYNALIERMYDTPDTEISTEVDLGNGNKHTFKTCIRHV